MRQVWSGKSRIDCSQGAVAGSKDCLVVVNDRGGACPAAEWLLNECGGGEKPVSRIEKNRTEKKKKSRPSHRIGLAVCIAKPGALPSGCFQATTVLWVVGIGRVRGIETWELDQ